MYLFIVYYYIKHLNNYNFIEYLNIKIIKNVVILESVLDLHKAKKVNLFLKVVQSICHQLGLLL